MTNRKALAALAAITLLCVLPTPSSSQRRAPEVPRWLLLARLTVHEAGWEDTGDMEAIHAVLTNGADREGMRYETFAASYARRAVGGAVIEGAPLQRGWAMELLPNCYTPASWPTTIYVRNRRTGTLTATAHAPWSSFRARCQAVMERAREVVAGTRVDSCERPPHDWGGRRDRARAERLGLIEVSCGPNTRQNYYRRPSLEGIEDALE